VLVEQHPDQERERVGVAAGVGLALWFHVVATNGSVTPLLDNGVMEGVVLRGLDLRYALVAVLLESRRERSVRELVVALERDGFALAGRPSKAVADALRWEVRRGRAVRVGRGRYRAGYVAKSTRSRMTNRVATLRRAVVAMTWNQ
jgi:hypothetical protein